MLSFLLVKGSNTKKDTIGYNLEKYNNFGSCTTTDIAHFTINHENEIKLDIRTINSDNISVKVNGTLELHLEKNKKTKIYENKIDGAFDYIKNYKYSTLGLDIEIIDIPPSKDEEILNEIKNGATNKELKDKFGIKAKIANEYRNKLKG